MIAFLVAGSETKADNFGRCEIETTAPEIITQALDSILSSAVDPESEGGKVFGTAPGAVLSVRAPGWRYTKSIGLANPDEGTPIDCQMSFQIGSNTKMITAAVLLQLHEEGMLSLDDLLLSHLPTISGRLPYGDSITLRQLAQHNSGIFSYTDNAPDGTPGIMEADVTDPAALRAGYSPLELVQFAIDHGTPSFAPGTEGAWSYSNTGYILIGLIIEGIEKKPLAEVFERRIFVPLGMQNTFFWNDVPDPDFGLARAYLQAPFDYETSDWNMSQGWAAGGVISTVEDMHRFIEVLVAGDLYKSNETLQLMKDTMWTGSLTAPYYGIGLVEKIGDGLWGHGGQTLGFESDVAVHVASGVSIVGWASSSNNIMALGAAAVVEALKKTGWDPNQP
ncbi:MULTISPECIES: serine hydrolase domain-containing protein [Falsihalocynthiibacter]|uniref:serine hydrolase domain-containing protein n=1 Tax=Falsihalocynthiibacter TaxID=2854182 RepID=UPI00300302D1